MTQMVDTTIKLTLPMTTIWPLTMCLILIVSNSKLYTQPSQSSQLSQNAWRTSLTRSQYDGKINERCKYVEKDLVSFQLICYHKWLFYSYSYGNHCEMFQLTSFYIFILYTKRFFMLCMIDDLKLEGIKRKSINKMKIWKFSISKIWLFVWGCKIRLWKNILKNAQKIPVMKLQRLQN